jgi:hypothetical protein
MATAESSHSSRTMDSPSFSCYPVRGICDSLSRAAEWLLSARTLLDATVHSLFVSRFNETVAGWAVESGNRSRGVCAKRTGSGSPASLLSGGSGRLACLVAGCVLLEHAEDTSRIARSAQGRSSALLHNAKGVFEMRLRDTIRRAAEPGIGDLACGWRQQILSSAALAAGLPNRDIDDRNWKTYRMKRD